MSTGYEYQNYVKRGVQECQLGMNLQSYKKGVDDMNIKSIDMG